MLEDGSGRFGLAWIGSDLVGLGWVGSGRLGLCWDRVLKHVFTRACVTTRGGAIPLKPATHTCNRMSVSAHHQPPTEVFSEVRFGHFYGVKLIDFSSMLKNYKVENAKMGSGVLQKALYEKLKN